MSESSPSEQPREAAQTPAEGQTGTPPAAEAIDLSELTQDLLEFSFVEVLAVPRLNRSCLSCS
jgi:hypothetical protein